MISAKCHRRHGHQLGWSEAKDRNWFVPSAHSISYAKNLAVRTDIDAVIEAGLFRMRSGCLCIDIPGIITGEHFAASNADELPRASPEEFRRVGREPLLIAFKNDSTLPLLLQFFRSKFFRGHHDGFR